MLIEDYQGQDYTQNNNNKVTSPVNINAQKNGHVTPQRSSPISIYESSKQINSITPHTTQIMSLPNRTPRQESTPILIRSDSFGYGRHSLSPPTSSPFSKSPLPNSPNESFAGSFQESLLSGRMANIPSTLFEGFYAVITCSYVGLSAAPKRQIPFNTYCYHVNSGAPPPYVATIDLEEKFKIPKDGLLQVTIFNPTQTPIKTFIVKYDLSDMPAKSKTFLRQTTTTKTVPSKLEYAVHFRIVSPKKKRFYIYKNIRIIFPPQKPDEKLSPLQTETVFPVNPKFYPLR